MAIRHTLSALVLGLAAIGAMAQTVVGVSWSNFQEERWKTDEAAIKAAAGQGRRQVHQRRRRRLAREAARPTSTA